ncbi:hypothetical protein [uncultured Aquimarina sp.]|uniref:CBU_0592 family membrane protein n=1 Tax=uncultured Aquimarina sp. TaxID=575652 RepID=UPI0026045951|nr:hypothetical protein [uncultured Aquimarina sp.]
MEFHTIIGSLGVSLLLIAYLLLQLRKIENTDLLYAVFNFSGAAMAMWSSYLIGFLPFMILEGIWTLVSFRMILKYKK